MSAARHLVRMEEPMRSTFLGFALLVVIPIVLMVETDKTGLPTWLPFAMLALSAMILVGYLISSPFLREERAQRRSLRYAERFLAEHEADRQG